MPLPGGLLQEACYSGQTPILPLSRLASWVTQALRSSPVGGMAAPTTGPPGADTHRLQARKQGLGLRGVGALWTCEPPASPRRVPLILDAHFLLHISLLGWRDAAWLPSPQPLGGIWLTTHSPRRPPLGCAVLRSAYCKSQYSGPIPLSWNNTGWLSLNRPDTARLGTERLDSELLPPPCNPGAAQHLAGEFGQ